MKVSRWLFTAACSCAALSATAFTPGDVFASIGNGLVKEFTPTGTLVQTLNTGLGAGIFTTGSAFDSVGNFYVTDFNGNSVSKFDSNGTLLGTFGSGYATDEDILIDGAGNTFISNLSGPGLQKFNSSGVLQASFASSQRIDWFDLNAAETIMYYTDESGTVHRWNLTANSALTNLGSGGEFALRLLGDGTMLAADGAQVSRINLTSGSTVQTYHPGGSELFALNLDPDGTSFWTGDINSGQIWRVNIATGAVITTFNSVPATLLSGLSVFGEITQVQPGTPEPSTFLMIAGALGLGGLRFTYRRAVRRS
jgi:hypothetical protein